jgi:16S rRNA (guanine527-N7)-methyltransferase
MYSIDEAKKALEYSKLPPVDLLAQYMVILMEVNQKVNLTGAKDFNTLAIKHICDCFKAWEILGGLKKPVLDVGSGGGLPGIVLAILSPNLPVTLVEKRKKKALFLREIVERLGLDKRVNVLDCAFHDLKNDVESSDCEIWFRGFMPFDEFFVYISKNFSSEKLGPLILMKGPNWQIEFNRILELKNINKDWLERFMMKEVLEYSLPYDQGQRRLILI